MPDRNALFDIFSGGFLTLKVDIGLRGALTVDADGNGQLMLR